jgi:hypothetical protein
VEDYAALWSGSPESWVNLNPLGSLHSIAWGVSGTRQVGVAWFDRYHAHAGMWSGTADSWMDLHSLLGTGWISSQALAVDVTDKDIWVAGIAWDVASGPNKAVLWHYTPDTVPEPSSLLALGSGLLALGGIVRRRR